MNKNNNDIDPAVREYMKRNAKKGGEAIKEKYGKEYFTDLINKRWGNRKKAERT